MGVCTYKGGTLPAGSRGMCTDYGGTWTEGDEKPSFSEEYGFADFSSAVGETWKNIQGGDDTAKENLSGYVTRRWKDDPAGLAFDAALMYGGGSLARLALTKTGIGGMLKNLFRKKTTKTKFKKPELVNGKIKKGTKFGEITVEGWTPRIMPSALIGGAAYQADKAGVLPFGIGPFSEAGKDAQYQRRLDTLKDTVAGLDKKATAASDKAATEKEAAEIALAEQNRIDNMSFYDKWKLGMKDPKTAALFGAGLRDIGSNIPGGNQLGEMQIDLADADAAMASANKKSASDFNATKVDTATLTDLFMNKKPFFKIGDSKVQREKAAAKKVALYQAVRAKLWEGGMEHDHLSVMRMLEEKFG